MRHVDTAAVRAFSRGRRISAALSRLVTVTVTVVFTLAVGGVHAAAEPDSERDPMSTAKPAPDGSRLISVTPVAGRQLNFVVHSTAMNKEITVRVLPSLATAEPRPAVYLLGGVEGNSEKYGWEQMTDVEDFFGDKNVNVVIPFGGKSSYYTDWQRDDPKLGRNRWETFLTKELPPIVDSALGTSGKNALAGLSMSTTAVLNLAIAAPDLYESVGAYSGCAMTSDPVGRRFVGLTVRDFGGDAENMWGPSEHPDWVAHDPYVNAEKLRGMNLYISTGSGLPGPYDTLDSHTVAGSPRSLFNQIVVGGALEAVTSECTSRLAKKLEALTIPATINLRPVGTHSWGYWQDDLHASWPMMASAVGA